jgi:hypothetical protein
MRGPGSNRLIAVLQTAAFPFRHHASMSRRSVTRRAPCSFAATGSRPWFRTRLRRLTTGCPHRDGSTGKLVETVGNAPTATILQGSSAPLCCPRKWCLELVSSQPLRVFGAALSPDQLPRRDIAKLVRTAGVEPTPPEWRSGTLPLSHVRHSAS